MKNERYTTLIALLFVGVVIGLTLLAYQYRNDSRFVKVSKALREGFNAPKKKGVEIVVVAGIEDKNLRLKLSIPIYNLKQKRKFSKRLSRIQHDLILSMGEPNMRQWVKRRNFKAIKKHVLKVVNHYSDVKIKKLYVENFFYN